ncbi:MAG TPA: twitching motility protein PilT, partial [Nitrospira sp.]|nr:twitching motility protein PilT [Candidatus Manganitrophaceae bacterium]
MGEKKALFRFYEELNDFLPPEKRKTDLPYRFHEKPAIKDPIEAIGIPHTEVDLILVNGKSVGFNYYLRHGDRVSVYPFFKTLDISPIVKLRGRPSRKSTFILDVHLGKLARLLRLLGFDVAYRNDYADPDIVRISVDKTRIILTRDRRLLFRKEITHVYCLRSTDPKQQLKEVLKNFDLYAQVNSFRRCAECNGKIGAVQKSEIIDQLEPKTILYYDQFYRCEDCRKIYWKGSHYVNSTSKCNFGSWKERQAAVGSAVFL